jgi:peroxiredoxin Q/BCP
LTLAAPGGSSRLTNFARNYERNEGMLEAGNDAPDFTLHDDNGAQVLLSALRDKPVVLFFYPKDDTPGCTIECKEFRDARGEFAEKAHVFGLSADDMASHQAFRDKYALNFPLLSDEGHRVSEAYGVWGPTPWGDGIHRTTFIVGTDGKIQKVFQKVKPEGHAQEVLAAL